MWKTYKKEIMEKEKKEADFLKKYYKYQTRKSDNQDQKQETKDETDNGDGMTDEKGNGQANIYDEEDWPVQVCQEFFFS